MWWFKHERVILIAVSAAMLLAILASSVSAWKRVAKIDAAAGMVQALTTNLSGRVVVYVDIELGAQDGK